MTPFQRLRLLAPALALCLSAHPAAGQSAEGIWLPEISWNRQLDDLYRVTAQLSAYQRPSELDRLEASFRTDRRLTVRTTLSVGYLVRIGTPVDGASIAEHRPGAHLTHSLPLRVHRFAQRARLEWRIRDSESHLRGRYRLSLRTPIRGERLDPGEPYLLIQNEALTRVSGAGAFETFDNRASLHLGWLLRNTHRIEFGLQHRLEKIGSGDPVPILLLGTAWHIVR